MPDTLRILALCGSLRKGSYNRSLLRALEETPPPGCVIEEASVAELPLFNQDLESALPPPVQKLKHLVKASDAVLFCSPEYNYSIPGPLKNAIDWASRPYGDNSWKGKPAAVLSASPGMLGGARMQYQLRQCFVFLEMPAFGPPEFMLPKAATKFNEQGRLSDPESRRLLEGFMSSFVAWASAQKRAAP
jgi:chromate reductase